MSLAARRTHRFAGWRRAGLRRTRWSGCRFPASGTAAADCGGPALAARLQKVPLGCGGRIDDHGFNLDDHLTVLELRKRPMTLVSLILRPASSPGRCPTTVPCGPPPCSYLIKGGQPDLVMHHVVGTDWRLAVLRGLLDGSPMPRAATFPRPRPPRRARTRRLERPGSLAAADPGAGRLLAAFDELGPSMAQRPAELAHCRPDRAGAPHSRGGGEPSPRIGSPQRRHSQ